MDASHPFAAPVLRMAFAFIGMALLWYGSAQMTVAGLIVMLCGLVALVSAVEIPRFSVRTPITPRPLSWATRMSSTIHEHR